jgi:uncharacterized protein (DUF1330 family)
MHQKICVNKNLSDIEQLQILFFIRFYNYLFGSQSIQPRKSVLGVALIGNCTYTANMGIKPTKEQLTAFLAAPSSGPIHMVNLLKFKAKTSDDKSGEASYNKYGENVIKMVTERGGKLVWHGKPMGVLIGDNEADKWDYIVIIEYPSREVMIEMTSNPKYDEIHGDREDGLERTALIPTRPFTISS